MEFKFKNGFIPKYYKELELKQGKNKLKKYICFLFIANMIIAPMTINKINEREDFKKQNEEKAIAINKPSINKNIKTVNLENLIIIMSIMKDNLTEIKYDNGKIFFNGIFKSQIEGEKTIDLIKTSLKKNLSYSSKLENEYYIFNVKEE